MNKIRKFLLGFVVLAAVAVITSMFIIYINNAKANEIMFNDLIKYIFNGYKESFSFIINKYHSGAPLTILIGTIIFGLMFITMFFKILFKRKILWLIPMIILFAAGFISFVIATFVVDANVGYYSETMYLVQYGAFGKEKLITYLGFIGTGLIFLSDSIGFSILRHC